MSGEERPEAALPEARARKRRVFRVAWIVPLIALIVAGWLVYERWHQQGPDITIRFGNGDGLRAGQTPIKYRGVPIGEVRRLELSDDHKQVVVTARMQRSAESLLRDGAVFWIVRPQVGFGNVTGLNTVLTGPEIQVLPGKGEARTEFNGLDNAPVALESPGLKIVLRAERPKSLKANSPVYYRGVEVGVVQKIDLSPNAASADVHVLIWQRYAPLARAGSTFWNSSGINLKGSLLKGVEVEFESVRALVTGGVEFATPSEKAPRVKPGTVFFLHEEPKKEWLGWAPRIPIPPE